MIRLVSSSLFVIYCFITLVFQKCRLLTRRLRFKLDGDLAQWYSPSLVCARL